MEETRRSRFEPLDLAYIAVFAAMLAAMSLAPKIPVGPLGVPITLQTLGVALAGLCLGPLRGFLAVALYVIVGAAGLPVFAGGTGGLAVLAGPTAGYLFSFPIAAAITGWFAVLAARKKAAGKMFLWFMIGQVVARFAAIMPLGIGGLMLNGGMKLKDAFLLDCTFLPGDLLKALIAAGLAYAVYKAFPRLLSR